MSSPLGWIDRPHLVPASFWYAEASARSSFQSVGALSTPAFSARSVR
ncbi:hypothetical protein M2168_004050 [Streptomyces sp. CZ24]|nr:hypothetical protein [Streptomyces sp. CZ24]